MSNKIEIGVWLDSDNYGPCVCVGLNGNTVDLRYNAIRQVDQKEIWVLNSEMRKNVRFLKAADEQSQYVLTLTGAYGEEKTLSKQKLKHL